MEGNSFFDIEDSFVVREIVSGLQDGTDQDADDPNEPQRLLKIHCSAQLRLEELGYLPHR